MIEPKTCPFCGGNPHISKPGYSEFWFINHTCKKQNPQLNIFSGGYKTYKDAIEAWNRRI